MKVDWEFIEQHPIDEWQLYYSLACNLCACGSDSVAELLHECLEWSALEFDERKTPEWKDGFYRTPGHELAAKVLDSWGLITHGSGIGWAWIEDDGRKLLELVRAQMAKEEAADDMPPKDEK